jgi:Mrp family chromosome partitioning ATPase
MAELIRELEHNYDLVLIDAPPLLPVTDAAVLAALASGVAIVTRYGHTKREQLARAVETLRAVGVAVYGAVLTMTPIRGPDSYYYGYGYRYDEKKRKAAKGERIEAVRPIARSAPPSKNGATPVEPTIAARPERTPDETLEFFRS